MQTHNSCPSTDGEKNRIYELDMLRGVAALIVAIFHTPHLFSGLAIPHGYLAVDVFFILSGYVMTHSYRSKILNGMSFRTFFVIRWARLYPLYLFSLIVAIAYYLLRLFLEKKPAEFHCLANNIFMLPCLQGAAFPLNSPAWSIFWEIFANAVWFSLLAFKVRVEAAICILSAIACTLIAFDQNAWVGGFDSNNLLQGSVRVLFGFYYGALIYDLGKSGKSLATVASLGLFGLIILITGLINSYSSPVLIDLLCVMTIFPICIFLLSRSTLKISQNSIGAWLGDISYSVYLLHIPISLFLQTTVKKLGFSVTDNYVVGLVFLSLLMMISTITYRQLEIPAKALLRNMAPR